MADEAEKGNPILVAVKGKLGVAATLKSLAAEQISVSRAAVRRGTTTVFDDDPTDPVIQYDRDPTDPIRRI